MTDPMHTKLRQFILVNFMIAPEDAGFGDSDSLLQSGVIDSMGVMEIAAFIKKEYGVTAAPADIRPENMDSIRAIADFVRKKRGS